MSEHPKECARCGRLLPPDGDADKLYGISGGDLILCLLCLIAYAEAAVARGVRPGPPGYGPKAFAKETTP